MSFKEISYYSMNAENGRNSILTNEKSGGRKVRAIASIDSPELGGCKTGHFSRCIGWKLCETKVHR